MKLYKVSNPGTDIQDHEDQEEVFAGTQADARKARIEFEAKYKELKKDKRPVVTVIELDVPTHKGGLIDFLNELVK